jgi:hypothetical protein
MAEGSMVYTLARFDKLMADFGLAPEDIGSTAKAVAAARRQWQIEYAKYILTMITDGSPAYTPGLFDRVMTAFDLAPEDIGSSADQIEAAKRQWAKRFQVIVV